MMSLALAVAFVFAPDQPPPLPTAPIDESDRMGLGSCLGQNGPIELRRALFLENRVLDFASAGGPARIALLGQTVRISARTPSGEERIYRSDIGEAVSGAAGDADVALKLALFEGRLVVYWRETVQHRIYLQGLFLVNGLGLTPLCQGRAGSETSH